MLDWFASPLLAPCTDCANLFAATFRVIRGGSFDNGATPLRAAGRYVCPSCQHEISATGGGLTFFSHPVLARADQVTTTLIQP